MKVGDCVIERKSNHDSQIMTIVRIIGKVICVYWFDKQLQLHKESFYVDELMICYP